MSFEAFKIGVALEVLNSITTRSINSLNADILRVISDFLTEKDMRMFTHVNTEVHFEWTGYRYISLNVQYGTGVSMSSLPPSIAVDIWNNNYVTAIAMNAKSLNHYFKML